MKTHSRIDRDVVNHVYRIVWNLIFRTIPVIELNPVDFPSLVTSDRWQNVVLQKGPRVITEFGMDMPIIQYKNLWICMQSRMSMDFKRKRDRKRERYNIKMHPLQMRISTKNICTNECLHYEINQTMNNNDVHCSVCIRFFHGLIQFIVLLSMVYFII